MKIDNEKVVTLTYDMYVGAEGEQEELMEQATAARPIVYCQGVGMMLPKFEQALAGKQAGDTFDFRIACADAYGEHDEQGVMTLDKKMFYNGDGEFDEERVYVGNIIPMNTVVGQVVNAEVVEVTGETVTIDLNHPLAGEDLHFKGEVVDVRDVTPEELEAIRHPHHCGGGCHKGKCKKDKGCCCEG